MHDRQHRVGLGKPARGGSSKKARRGRSTPVAVRPPENLKMTVIEGAEKFLTDEFGFSLDLHPKALLEEVIASAVRFFKGSEAQQLRAVATAYALYVFDQRMGGELTSGLEDELGIARAVRKNYDPIRWYLERTIHYGSDTSNETNHGPNWSYCRDARAIRHLMDRGVGPDGLIRLAGMKGEGLDAWGNARGVKDERQSQRQPAFDPLTAGEGKVLKVLKDGEMMFELRLENLSDQIILSHLKMLADYEEMAQMEKQTTRSRIPTKRN